MSPLQAGLHGHVRHHRQAALGQQAVHHRQGPQGVHQVVERGKREDKMEGVLLQVVLLRQTVDVGHGVAGVGDGGGGGPVVHSGHPQQPGEGEPEGGVEVLQELAGAGTWARGGQGTHLPRSRSRRPWFPARKWAARVSVVTAASWPRITRWEERPMFTHGRHLPSHCRVGRRGQRF